jgi:hypothetical protein
MKLFVALVLWCLLLVACWPLALMLMVLFPIVWIIALPFRILGFTLDFIFKFIKAVLLFPFKVVKAI